VVDDCLGNVRHSFDGSGVTMYAIIRDGGKQYRVEEGDELRLDYRDVPSGDRLTINDVLAVASEGDLLLGKPVVDGAAVTAEVLGPAKGDKLVVQKLRRRSHNSRTKTGHRQLYTKVRIEGIAAPGMKRPADTAEKDVAANEAETTAAEPEPVTENGAVSEEKSET